MMRQTIGALVALSTLLLAAWAVLGGPESGETAFPGFNGRIVFTKEGAGTNDADVYVMNADGSNVQPLAESAQHDSAPNWSPDGTKIVFETRRDGDYEIYVMNSDGSGQTNLSNFPSENDLDPVWSPDGTKIAFTSFRDDGTNIIVMNANGSGQTNVTNAAPGENNSHPAWSPDGSRIAFRHNPGGAGNIYTMDPDGSNLMQLTTSGEDFDPAWSPDGTQIAFRSTRGVSSDIYVMDADGAGETNITNSPTAFDREPAWSPDGTRILFSTDDEEGDDQIYSMNPDGSDPVRISDNSDDDTEPDWQPLAVAPTPSPTPSPSSTPSPSPTPTPVATPIAPPTPSPTPSPELVQGDNDCDDDTDAVDALKGLQHVAAIPFQQQPDCPNIGAALLAAAPASDPPDLFGDVDCDNDTDAVDALKILQFVAAIPFAQNEPCTDIGIPF